MEVVVFDVKGPFAHFRAYDTTRRNMTYPFPPKTSIVGLIAGILGLPRNDYWKNNSLKDASISIQLLNPIWRSKITVNYLQLKYPISLSAGVKIYMAKDPLEIKSKDQRGFNAPVSLNILRNVKYRIFFYSEDNELRDELIRRLEENRYCYPPYLGHANMLAQILYVGKLELISLDQGIHEVVSIIPVSSLDQTKISLDSLGYSILFNVPCKLSLSEENYVYLSESQHLILNEPSDDQGLKACFKDNEVKEVVFEGKSSKIVFW